MSAQQGGGRSANAADVRAGVTDEFGLSDVGLLPRHRSGFEQSGAISWFVGPGAAHKAFFLPSPIHKTGLEGVKGRETFDSVPRMCYILLKGGI